MRKKFLTTVALLAGVALCAAAQGESKLDVRSRMQLAVPQLSPRGLDMEAAPAALPKARRVAEMGAADQVAAFVRLNDGYTREDLEAEGVTVLNRRGSIVLVAMPKADAMRVAALDCVKSMQLERPVSAKMDLARPASTVDCVMTGLDLPQAYTGKGVLAGIVDGGFDPNHINFRGEDGYSRIRYFVVNSANSNNKITSQWFTDDPNAVNWPKSDGYAGTLADYTTDNSGNTHGTHTLGIMAGNYRGPINAVTSTTSFASTVEQLDENPWYGIASEATLMAVAGTSSDALIAAGIDNIEGYSSALGCPTVINLSLGSNLGPHDGSGSINLYMDELAETEGYVPITFCLASGNEGAYPIAINQELTDDNTTIKTGLYPFLTASSEFSQSGYLYYRNVELDIYSADETPIDVSAVVFNAKRPAATSYTASMPLLGEEATTDGAYKLYCSDAEVQEEVGGTINEAFGKYYKGMVYLANGIEVNQLSGEKRFVIHIFINALKRVENNAYVDPDDNYAMGLIVTSAAGNRVGMYGDGLMVAFDDYDRPGWVNGSTDGTINDMATGKKVIAVGAYNTRNIYGGLDGSAPFNDSATFPLGEVSTFSSYGTLADGRTLPHVCAPGTYLISSVSQYYVEDADNYLTEGDIQGIVVEGSAAADGTTTATRRNYWQAMAGTSMSTPYVAGAIALWLEADPTLTPTDIQDIIAATAIRDDDVAKGNPAQWGAGKFDAYAGLKEVLRRKGASSGIGGIVADAEVRPVITADGYRCFRVFLAGASSLRASLYDMAGRLAGSYHGDGDELRVDANSLATGIYVLRIDGCAQGQRIIIK